MTSGQWHKPPGAPRGPMGPVPPQGPAGWYGQARPPGPVMPQHPMGPRHTVGPYGPQGQVSVPGPVGPQGPVSPIGGVPPHGAKGDRRYPSSRTLRRTLAFAVDWLVHLGAAVAVFFATRHTPLPTVNAVGAWLGASFVDRVLVQWACRATLGKLIFGLCVVRPSDGARPGFGQLVKLWLIGLWFSVLLFGELGGGSGGDGPDLDDHLLGVVRRRDVRALARAMGLRTA